MYQYVVLTLLNWLRSLNGLNNINFDSIANLMYDFMYTEKKIEKEFIRHTYATRLISAP